MVGQSYPVAEIYKNNIVDGETVSRRGNWWTAVLLIRNPKTGKLFTKLYMWELRDGVWKTAQSFKIGKLVKLKHITLILQKFSAKQQEDSDNSSDNSQCAN